MEKKIKMNKNTKKTNPYNQSIKWKNKTKIFFHLCSFSVNNNTAEPCEYKSFIQKYLPTISNNNNNNNNNKKKHNQLTN